MKRNIRNLRKEQRKRRILYNSAASFHFERVSSKSLRIVSPRRSFTQTKFRPVSFVQNHFSKCIQLNDKPICNCYNQFVSKFIPTLNVTVFARCWVIQTTQFFQSKNTRQYLRQTVKAIVKTEFVCTYTQRALLTAET